MTTSTWLHYGGEKFKLADSFAFTTTDQKLHEANQQAITHAVPNIVTFDLADNGKIKILIGPDTAVAIRLEESQPTYVL